MATYTTTKTASGAPTRYFETGVWVETATYDSSASISAGDVVQMVNVPAGAKVRGIEFVSTQNGTLEVGDGISVDRYFGSASVAANTISRATLLPDYEYSADDTVDIRFVAAETSATVRIHVMLSADDT